MSNFGISETMATELMNKDDLILFCAPEAGVGPHFLVHCIVARTLQDLGYNVLFTHCYKTFERCPVMDMYVMPYDADDALRTNICNRCTNTSSAMLAAYGLKRIQLDSFLSPDVVIRYYEATAELPRDLRDFEFDSIKFGMAAALDFVLVTKKSNFGELDEKNYAIWLQYIKSSVLNYLLFNEICQHNRVGRILHFNDYSLLLGSRFAAQKNNVPTLTLTLAQLKCIDRQRYIIIPDILRAVVLKQFREWGRNWRDLALDNSQVSEMTDDIIIRLQATGSHIFSPKKSSDSDLYSQLGLNRDKKVIVAYTSSIDEYMSSKMTLQAFSHPFPEVSPFGTELNSIQINWLTELTQFVESHHDVQLVVRVHPREGVNKRDSVVSEHLVRLKSHFGKPFKNCQFVWPEDQVSSYDLGEIADVVLTAWSTMGVEMARLGVPVLAVMFGIATISGEDFIECAETPEEYFRKLEILLERSVRPNLEVMLHAMRFSRMFAVGIALNLDDVIPSPSFDGIAPYHLPREAEAIRQVVVEGRHILDVNLKRLQSVQHPLRHQSESAEMKRQLRRLIHFLFTGEAVTEDYELVLSETGSGSHQGTVQAIPLPVNTRLLIDDGFLVHYLSHDRKISKRSIMAHRLAKLCAQHQTEGLIADAPPEIANHYAELLCQAGALLGSRRILLTLIAKDPTSLRVLNNLAVIDWLEGQPEAALRRLEQAHQLSPSDRLTIQNMTDLFINLKQLNKAKELLRSFLQQNPNEIELRTLLNNLETIA